MPLSDKQREHIIQVAESCYGTPYRGWSCVKGAGFDCGQFLKYVYLEAGHNFPDGIPTPEIYSLQVAQHREDPTYRNIVETYMQEIPESEVKPGDVVVYKIGKAFAHAAIIKQWPNHIIHVLEHYGVTGGHGLNHMFSKFPRKFFTLKNEFVAQEK